MPVYKIHSMKWSDSNKSSITMICDTHEGNNMITSTVYGPASGLWDDIKNYDQNLIEPYDPPPTEPAI